MSLLVTPTVTYKYSIKASNLSIIIQLQWILFFVLWKQYVDLISLYIYMYTLYLAVLQLTNGNIFTLSGRWSWSLRNQKWLKLNFTKPSTTRKYVYSKRLNTYFSNNLEIKLVVQKWSWKRVIISKDGHRHTPWYVSGPANSRKGWRWASPLSALKMPQMEPEHSCWQYTILQFHPFQVS